jgi:leucyl aminopeptidase (aminopeptidase T)
MDIIGVSSVVWKKCVRAEKHERALILADPYGERLEIARALKRTGPCFRELAVMEPTGMHGSEPHPEAAELMMNYDILVAPLEQSITHTKAVLDFVGRGGRAVTMPGITMDTFLRAVAVDYDELTNTNTRLRNAISGADTVRVTTKAGTDISMRLAKGRKICNNNGVVRPGKVTNIPDGEVSFAPLEGTAEGMVVFDVSALGKMLKKPFRAVVKDGVLVSCENKELLRILSGSKDGTNFAELGIGTNPLARVTGSILEDEKVLGTAHIAFGTNADMGGAVQASVHIDSVFSKPTVALDGKAIIKDGKFLF